MMLQNVSDLHEIYRVWSTHDGHQHCAYFACFLAPHSGQRVSPEKQEVLVTSVFIVQPAPNFFFFRLTSRSG